MTPLELWHFVVSWTRTEVPARAKMFRQRASHQPGLLFVAIMMAMIVLSMYAAILSQGAA